MATTINKPVSKPSVLWAKVPPRKTPSKEVDARLFKEAVKYG